MFPFRRYVLDTGMDKKEGSWLYEIAQAIQNWLNRLQMVQFECPRHPNPSVSSISEVGRIPFSQY